MNQQAKITEPTLPDANADLETVLAAWHTATVRLEKTHRALREEVGRLTDELEVKNRELARKNRLADLGQMASHIAHEVRNNLMPVTLYLSLLRRRVSEDSGSLEVLDKITAGFTALDATVHDLLHFTADRDPQLHSFSPRKVIDDVHASLAPQFSAQAIKTVTQIPKDLLVTADQEMFRRAVLNLTLNALDAMPDGGTLKVASRAREGGAELEVSDTGPGLSQEAKDKVFEPFFTTKRGGTGLGLAIVYRVAEVHGGEVTADNTPEGGAAFKMHFPRQSSELEDAA